MLRLFVGIFATFWVGVVFAEVISTAELVQGGGRGSLLCGTGFAFVFACQEAGRVILDRRSRSPKTTPGQLITAYHIGLGVLCLLILASFPFLWWGIIKELARVPMP